MVSLHLAIWKCLALCWQIICHGVNLNWKHSWNTEPSQHVLCLLTYWWRLQECFVLFAMVSNSFVNAYEVICFHAKKSCSLTLFPNYKEVLLLYILQVYVALILWRENFLCKCTIHSLQSWFSVDVVHVYSSSGKWKRSFCHRPKFEIQWLCSLSCKLLSPLQF